MKKYKRVFLDAASNTPLDKRVLRAMRPYLSNKFVGNTHSTHSFGVQACRAIDYARHQIATISGFQDSEIYFTSGASEGNNWILKSLALHELFHSEKPKLHMVVSAIEHNSILKACKELEGMGISISYAQPNYKGQVTHVEIKPLLRPDTLLVMKQELKILLMPLLV